MNVSSRGVVLCPSVRKTSSKPLTIKMMFILVNDKGLRFSPNTRSIQFRVFSVKTNFTVLIRCEACELHEEDEINVCLFQKYIQVFNVVNVLLCCEFCRKLTTFPMTLLYM